MTPPRFGGDQPIVMDAGQHALSIQKSSPNLTRALSDLDASLVETAFSYIEGGDPDGAAQYLASMSDEGVKRLYRNLASMVGMVGQEARTRDLYFK